MNVKELLKPNALKILIFLSIGIVYLYFAVENICGVSFYFAFCYKAYGFPLSYMVIGDVNSAFGYIKTLFLGNYFTKSKNFLFNPLSLILNIISIYALTCFIAELFKNMKIKLHSKPKIKT